MTRKTTTRNCLQCNNTFHPAVSEVRRGNGKFCSLSCVCIYRNKHYMIRTITTVTKTCNFCQKKFHHKPYEGIGKFCSLLCKNKSMKGQRPGHLQQNIRRKLKEIAFKNYGKRCEVCGYSLSVDVHHLIPRSQNGLDEKENLAVLCPNHHREMHIGILTREDVLNYRKPVEMEGYEPSSKTTIQKHLQA